jgi:hypothetical protein
MPFYLPEHIVVILTGILAGTFTRFSLLRVDYRQYPGYPHAYLAHLFLGFIASALGAVAVPAILKPDYAAVTFLVLAAQQFREIRSMERSTLESLEKTELVKRGLDYIEGIARTFEARNYLAMGTAFAASLGMESGGLPWAVAVAAGCFALSCHFMSGNVIGDICEVVPARISFNRTILMVDEIGMMTIGLKEMREKIVKEGLAVKIVPKNANARATIHDMGQRAAMAFTASVIVGTKKDIDIPEFTPMARKNPDSGEVGLYIVPVEYDMAQLVAAVRLTPVLESASSKPLKSGPGLRAAQKRR